MLDTRFSSYSRRLTGWLAAAISLFLLVACAATPPTLHNSASECLSTVWPHEQSDLDPDPALIFGRLENGIRYVLMPNAEPKNRVGIYLNVQAGSLHETEKQRGLAHYLEHMLFNGTTHFPPGTLVEYFQSIGMGFGADTNAHTGFDETVYKLLLPAGDPATIDQGMQVLADYAGEALLLKEEVDRERGIILAEKRSRDSVAARVRKAQLRFDFAGTLVAERDPIGTEEVLLAADNSDLRGYYSTWYRPENMVVVIVGDMPVKTVEALVAKHFDGLTAEAPPPQCPEFGKVRETGTTVLSLHEPELGYTRVSYGVVYNQSPVPPTRAWEEQQLHRFVAATLLKNRLDQLTHEQGSPFTSADSYSGLFLRAFGYGTVTAATDEEQWPVALATLRETVNQALHTGFTTSELERVKKEILAYLKKQQQTAATRSSQRIASGIIRKLNSGEVILSPAQELALYEPMLDTMTVEDANNSFARQWQRDRRLVQVVGTAEPGTAGSLPEHHILQALAQPGRGAARQWDAHQEVFPYLERPTTTGTILEQSYHQDVGVESIVLEGGVRVNIKRTPFQRRQVKIAVHFGQGKLSEPSAGLAQMARNVIQESGFGRLNRQQLDQVLAGKTATLSFNVGPESFSLTGEALSEELELLLQLVYAQLHDPAFRQTAFDHARQRSEKMYEQLHNTIEGQERLAGMRFFTGDNPSYAMAGRDQVLGVQLEQIIQWLEPVFARAPLEINIVGDIDPIAAAELVERYFGNESRIAESQMPRQPVTFPTGKQHHLLVQTSVDKAVISVAWKTDDFWDIGKTRRLNLLSSVLDDRLRVKIREELGATYSPVVYNQSSRTHKGFGLLMGRMTVAPELADKMVELVKTSAAALGSREISKEELQRALSPTLTAIRDARRSNGYWLNAVLALSSRHPEQLEWPMTIIDDFQSITTADIRGLAASYLQPETAAAVVVQPQ